MEDKGVIVSKEGFEKLEKELDYLRTTKRAEIAEKIKVALGFGDLSENSEYDEAKNAQAENEGKIAELENKIRYAKIIDESEIDTKIDKLMYFDGNIINNVKLIDNGEFELQDEYNIQKEKWAEAVREKIENNEYELIGNRGNVEIK